MYTFIAQDTQGNSFISKESFETAQQALESSYTIAEYDFIVSVSIMRCQDIVFPNN